MLAHSCLFVLLSLMSDAVYICTVLFEQINDDDDVKLMAVNLSNLNRF